jgi:DNA-binding CsgD family transcriptional regulator
MSVGSAAISLLDMLGEVVPRPSLSQRRRLLSMGIVLRWVTIALGAAGAMLVPSFPGILYQLTGAIVYNAIVMVVVSRAPASWTGPIAITVTVIDQLFCLSYLAIYAASLPGGQPLGGYALGTLEAVAFFGVPGAILSVGMFTVGATLAFTLGPPVLTQSFNQTGLLGAVLVIVVVAVSLVGVFHVLLQPSTEVRVSADGEHRPPRRATGLVTGDRQPISLSRREREVLELVAEGYSNTMIARRLGLSESTVKSYVENLLVRLNVRNRAEAVATASRLKLL